VHSFIHIHTRLMALCPGLPRWAGTRKVKPIWILLKQETVIGSGISWAICKSAPCSRQITTPAPHHSSFFYRPDALPVAQPTASKHWRYQCIHWNSYLFVVVCWSFADCKKLIAAFGEVQAKYLGKPKKKVVMWKVISTCVIWLFRLTVWFSMTTKKQFFQT